MKIFLLKNRKDKIPDKCLNLSNKEPRKRQPSVNYPCQNVKTCQNFLEFVLLKKLIKQKLKIYSFVYERGRKSEMMKERESTQEKNKK